MSSNRRRCHEQREEVIISPTKTIVNTRTNRRVVKHIHPTEIVNVNRTIVSNEHYYPVSEREVCETVEESFDFGSDFDDSNRLEIEIRSEKKKKKKRK
ncbi:CotD family spore coat protein [Peribacillus simplex]|uniref:CotD family spore coat protein n=1 Tax=Peribacillus simplex TaxID=1478 RepID=UPI003D2E5446